MEKNIKLLTINSLTSNHLTRRKHVSRRKIHDQTPFQGGKFITSGSENPNKPPQRNYIPPKE
jgi:hypothetical protein